ncbi:MAG: acyl carrier protein [Bacteroidetes bacterium]|nr:MAG: acyl carrier protein [Bacteroidota bacterium]
MSLNVNFDKILFLMAHQLNASAIRKEMLLFLKDSHGLSEQVFSAEKSLKDFGIDSFKIIELILFVENKFNISFPETSYTAENLKSVDSIIACMFQFHDESSQ